MLYYSHCGYSIAMTEQTVRPLLSRILWYRRAEGSLVPLELTLDAPAVLGGENGAGKTTILRIFPFLLGVERLASLRPGAGLESFVEFYLRDALLLAEFAYPRVRTYVFSDTSQGLRVLELPISLEGVRDRVEAFLRGGGKVSRLFRELKDSFGLEGLREMGYGEYVRSLPFQAHERPLYLGELLQALLQDRVNLKAVAQKLGAFLDGEHRITEHLKEFGRELERSWERARKLLDLNDLLGQFPPLRERRAVLLGKAGVAAKAVEETLPPLMDEKEARLRELEGRLKEVGEALSALKVEKDGLGDRKALERERRDLERELSRLKGIEDAYRKDALGALRALGKESQGLLPEEARRGLEEVREEEEGLRRRLDEVQEEIGKLRHGRLLEVLREKEGRWKELCRDEERLKGVMEALGLEPAAPLPALEGALERARELYREWDPKRKKEALVVLEALEGWERPHEPPPGAFKRYLELGRLLDEIRLVEKRKRLRGALGRLSETEGKWKRRLEGIAEEEARLKKALFRLEEGLLRLRRERQEWERRREEVSSALARLFGPGTLLAYLKGLEEVDWTRLARPLRPELLFRTDLSPRFMGEGGLLLDVERIEWKDPEAELRERLSEAERALAERLQREGEDEAQRAALSEELRALGKEREKVERTLRRLGGKVRELQGKVGGRGFGGNPEDRLLALYRKAVGELGWARREASRQEKVEGEFRERLPALLPRLRDEVARLEAEVFRLRQASAEGERALRELKGEERALSERVRGFERAREALERFLAFWERHQGEMEALREALGRLEERLVRLDELTERERGLLKEKEELEREKRQVEEELLRLRQIAQGLEEILQGMREFLEEEKEEGVLLPGQVSLEEAQRLLEERAFLLREPPAYMNKKAVLRDRLTRLLAKPLPSSLSGMEEAARKEAERLFWGNRLGEGNAMNALPFEYGEALLRFERVLRGGGALPVELPHLRIQRVVVELDREREKQRRVEALLRKYEVAQDRVSEDFLPLLGRGGESLVLEEFCQVVEEISEELEELLQSGVMTEARVELIGQKLLPEGWKEAVLSEAVKGSLSGGLDVVAGVLAVALALRGLLGGRGRGALPLPVDEFGRFDRHSSLLLLKDLPGKLGFIPVLAVPNAYTADMLADLAEGEGFRLRAYQVKGGFVRKVRVVR